MRIFSIGFFLESDARIWIQNNTLRIELMGPENRGPACQGTHEVIITIGTSEEAYQYISEAIHPEKGEIIKGPRGELLNQQVMV